MVNSAATMNGKDALRREMKQRLGALDPEARGARSRRLVQCLASLPEWKTARSVLLFAPLPAEPDLDILWAAGHLADKRCAYPRVEGERLTVFEVTALTRLVAGPWSLREPPRQSGTPLSPAGFDVVLVPGLAFTKDGKRLGRGGGYYDRLLAETGSKPRKIGCAFEFQILDDLPTEGHDAPVDDVVTDSLSES